VAEYKSKIKKSRKTGMGIALVFLTLICWSLLEGGVMQFPLGCLLQYNTFLFISYFSNVPLCSASSKKCAALHVLKATL